MAATYRGIMKKNYSIFLVLVIATAHIYPMALVPSTTWGYIKKIKQFCKNTHGIPLIVTSFLTILAIRKLYFAHHRTVTLQQYAIAEQKYYQDATVLDKKINPLYKAFEEKLKRNTPEIGLYPGYYKSSLQAKQTEIIALQKQIMEYEKNHDWQNALTFKQKIVTILQPPA